LPGQPSRTTSTDCYSLKGRLLIGTDPASVMPELDELLSSPLEPVRQDAARLRVVCALPADGVEWSEDAERILGEADATLAAVMKATKLVQDGEQDGAERLLLPHVDDVRALRSSFRHNSWNAHASLRNASIWRRCFTRPATHKRRSNCSPNSEPTPTSRPCCEKRRSTTRWLRCKR